MLLLNHFARKITKKNLNVQICTSKKPKLMFFCISLQAKFDFLLRHFEKIKFKT